MFQTPPSKAGLERDGIGTWLCREYLGFVQEARI